MIAGTMVGVCESLLYGDVYKRQREQQADVRIEGSEIHYQMTRPLGFREGLTAVVGWDKGCLLYTSRCV